MRIDAGLVDALAYEDQLDDHGAVSKSGTVEGESYGRSRRRRRRRGAPRVAVVYITGIINSGDSGFDPLNGDVAGSTRLVKAIRSARADDDVRAIVVRIDSPGGSSIASDVIWRELTVTKNEKPARPLVASMSDLAASGGYYVAMAAPHIVAQPATLTGSIGIYGGKFVTGGTYEKLGANIEAVIIGRNAGIESPERPFTDSERAEAARADPQTSTRASSRRSRRRERCPSSGSISSAQGRVWTGAQAREHGLVDALGGLDRADRARERARRHLGRDRSRSRHLPGAQEPCGVAARTAERLGQRPPDRGGVVDCVGAADRRTPRPRLLTAPARLFSPGEPLALMPVSFLNL